MKNYLTFILIILFSLALAGCSLNSQKPSETETAEIKRQEEKQEEKQDEVGLANPASVHCLDKGGELRMEEDEKGQYGICILPDGTECEEWQYFRGECP